MNYTFMIAGHSISIKSLYADVIELCRDFVTEVPPELEIRTDPEAISAERERQMMRDIEAGRPLVQYNNRLIECDVVCGLIAKELLQKGLLMLECTLADTGSGVCLCIGGGLSLFNSREVYRGKVLIGRDGDSFTAHGTPFCGRGTQTKNIRLSLSFIYMTETAEEALASRGLYIKGTESFERALTIFKEITENLPKKEILEL